LSGGPSVSFGFGDRPAVRSRSRCSPAYPGVCLLPRPDLDCGDISPRNFQVWPPDPHHVDGDRDGIGRET
jgi:micrococcal nuclease